MRIMENKDFDKFIREGLEKNRPDFDPNDWEKMEDLLDEQERQGKELLYIKGIEMVLVALAVMTLFRFYPTDVATNSPMAHIELKEDVNIDNHHKGIEHKPEINHTIEKSESLNIIQDDSKGTPSASHKEIVRASDAKVYDIIKGTWNGEPNFIMDEPSIKNTFSKDSPIKNVAPIHSAKNQNSTANNSIVPEKSVVEEKEIISEEIQAPVDLTALKHQPSELLDDQINIPKEFAINVSRPTIRMGFYTGYDFNHIITPYDPKVKSSYEQGKHGFSAGYLFSILKGNWEFESGLSYSRKSYTPVANVIKITGNTDNGFEAETLDRLSFNLVSLPMNVKYYFPRMSKWKFYAMAGGAMNVVGWSNVNQKTVEANGSRNPNLIAEDTQAKKYTFKKSGVFFGESLKNNYYITANLGVGVERRLNTNTSVFFQPKFSYYLMPSDNGLGPNKDRFNTMSVDLGFKYDF